MTESSLIMFTGQKPTFTKVSNGSECEENVTISRRVDWYKCQNDEPVTTTRTSAFVSQRLL